MDELANAKRLMNAAVREELESRDIFDPASLDAAPHPLAAMADLPPVEIPWEETLGPEDLTCFGGPRAPWEPIP